MGPKSGRFADLDEQTFGALKAQGSRLKAQGSKVENLILLGGSNGVRNIISSQRL